MHSYDIDEIARWLKYEEIDVESKSAIAKGLNTMEGSILCIRMSLKDSSKEKDNIDDIDRAIEENREILDALDE